MAARLGSVEVGSVEVAVEAGSGLCFLSVERDSTTVSNYKELQGSGFALRNTGYGLICDRCALATVSPCSELDGGSFCGIKKHSQAAGMSGLGPAQFRTSLNLADYFVAPAQGGDLLRKLQRRNRLSRQALQRLVAGQLAITVADQG